MTTENSLLVVASLHVSQPPLITGFGLLCSVSGTASGDTDAECIGKLKTSLCHLLAESRRCVSQEQFQYILKVNLDNGRNDENLYAILFAEMESAAKNLTTKGGILDDWSIHILPNDKARSKEYTKSHNLRSWYSKRSLVSFLPASQCVFLYCVVEDDNLWQRLTHFKKTYWAPHEYPSSKLFNSVDLLLNDLLQITAQQVGAKWSTWSECCTWYHYSNHTPTFFELISRSVVELKTRPTGKDWIIKGYPTDQINAYEEECARHQGYEICNFKDVPPNVMPEGPWDKMNPSLSARLHSFATDTVTKLAMRLPEI